MSEKSSLEEIRKRLEEWINEIKKTSEELQKSIEKTLGDLRELSEELEKMAKQRTTSARTGPRPLRR